MLKMMYILGVCTTLAALCVLARCGQQWRRDDPELNRLQDRPNIVQMFKEGAARHRENAGKPVSPLVAQAQEMALYLNPPALPEKVVRRESRSASRSTPAPTPAIQPVAPSLKFALYGTSYYPNQPGRSMALISEPGGSEADGKWVKEGDQLGHFVVHEIRKGMVVFRSGDDLRELAVKKGRASRSLVRGVRSDSRQANAVVSTRGLALPPSIDADRCEVAGV